MDPAFRKGLPIADKRTLELRADEFAACIQGAQALILALQEIRNLQCASLLDRIKFMIGEHILPETSIDHPRIANRIKALEEIAAEQESGIERIPQIIKDILADRQNATQFSRQSPSSSL